MIYTNTPYRKSPVQRQAISTYSIHQRPAIFSQQHTDESTQIQSSNISRVFSPQFSEIPTLETLSLSNQPLQKNLNSPIQFAFLAQAPQSRGIKPLQRATSDKQEKEEEEEDTSGSEEEAIDDDEYLDPSEKRKGKKKEWYEKRTMDPKVTEVLVTAQSDFSDTFYVAPGKPANPKAKRQSSSGQKKTDYDREHKTDFVAISEATRELASKHSLDEQTSKAVLALAEVKIKNLRLMRHKHHKELATIRRSDLAQNLKLMNRARIIVGKAYQKHQRGVTKPSYYRDKLAAMRDSKQYIFDTKLGRRRKRRPGDPPGNIV